MSVILSVAIFLAVLFVLILVHEWGHYIVAKITGMRVDEFGIGFPPKIFSFRKGETEYTLNTLPIGGFVRIYGENGDDENNDNDSNRAFGKRPKWAQILVLLAGVSMNMLLAWVLFLTILLIGIPTAVEEGQQSTEAKLIITDVLPKSPADQLVPSQSVILQVVSLEDSLAELTPSAFSDFMINHGEEEVLITYINNDTTNTATLIPTTGVLSSTSTQPAIGVALALVDTVHYSFIDALAQATKQTAMATKAVAFGIGNLLKGMVTGTADYSQVSGPVGIVGYVGDAASVGLTSLLYFMAIISINLAIINLLPVPALDGGRIIFVLIEAIIRRPINVVWASRVNFAGFVLLIVLMILVTVNDVLKLW